MLNPVRARAWRALVALAAALPLLAAAAPQLIKPFQGPEPKVQKAKPFHSQGARIQFNLAELRNLVPGQEVELTLPDGAKHAIVMDLLQDKGSGITSWVGHYKDATPILRTIITTGPGGTFGRIATPDNEYTIMPGPGDGSDWIVDMKAEKPFLPPIDLHHDAHTPKLPKSSMVPETHEPQPVDLVPGVNTAAVPKSAAAISTPPGVVVDILMVYTNGLASSLATYTGNPSAIQTRLAQLITSANTIFADSGVGVTLRMVGSQAVSYSDSVKTTTGALMAITPGVQDNDNTDPDNDLANGGLDPAFSNVETLRTQYGADMVTLLRDGYTNGGDGVAWVPNAALNSNWASLMYSAMTGCTMSCDWVWVHEIGHNFGSAHDRATNAWENSGTNVPGSFSYSYGYYSCQGGRFALSCSAFSSGCTPPQNGGNPPECDTPASGTNNYSDIMAYFQGSTVKNMVFSNPLLFTCQGNTGPQGACGSGQAADSADAASTLNNNRTAMSQMKATVVPLTVASTTALVSAPNPSLAGQAVTLTATVTASSGTPAGTVAFKDGGAAIAGCGAVSLGAGTAVCTTSALAAGSHSLTAAYSGSSAHNASTSSVVTQTVNAKAAATVRITSTSPNPSTTGQYLTFTATVSGASGTPGGTVTFTDSGAALGGCSAVVLAGGTATCTTSAFAMGSHTIYASYSGNATYNSAVSGGYGQTVLYPASGLDNVALAVNGAVASASSQLSSDYPVSSIIDGDRAGVNWTHGGGWADGTFSSWPDWVQVDFGGPKSLTSVVVYTVQDNYATPVQPTDTTTFTQYGITDFNVQGWNGSQWVTLATVTGNNLVKRTVTFNAFTTTKIRINVTSGLYYVSRITEVEAWGTTTTNMALASNGTVASASSQLSGDFPVAAINDGERAGVNWTHGGGWADGTVSQWPDWVQLDFNGLKTLTSVVLYTIPDNYTSPPQPTDATTFSQYGVTDFNVQGWNGSQWVTLATVSGNNLVKRMVTFSPFTTSKIRINVTGALYYVSRIAEVEAWGTAPTNVALASNGAVALASSQLSSDYPIAAINDGERAGANWTHGGGWADGTLSAWPDWVEIDFNAAKTLGAVTLYTVQDNYTTPVQPTDATTFSQYGVTDFNVQGWNGTQWVALGSVSGNNLVKRSLSFAPFTTTKIRVNVTGALYYVSRIVELEAWGN